MKLTAQIQLHPSKEQHELLLATLERCNSACNAISEVAWEQKVWSKYSLQKKVYHDIKQAFDLSAQMTILCAWKVAYAYAIDKKVKRSFRKHGSVAYDSRVLTYFPEKGKVSIWTVGKREKMSFVCGGHQAKMLEYQKGESDLAYINGRWYLFATCEIPSKGEKDFEDYLGVDLGIVNIATTSDGQSFSGDKIEAKRQWFADRKTILQKVGTKSAKRRLRKLSGKEKRFRKDTSHVISKKIVQVAKDTNRGIAIEDLTGIRKGMTVRKKQRAKHHSWGFYQLRQFIEYKAKRNGIPVVSVDPRNTSRTCSECGHCENANRRTQSEFVCRGCGHVENADRNAAKNIKTVAVNLRMASSLAA